MGAFAMTAPKTEYSIEEVAGLLGRSVRQVRYMLQTGQLKGQKSGRRWLVRKEDLPNELPQEKADQLAAVETSATRADQKYHRYSVRDLKAFEAGLPLYQIAADAFGTEHPITQRIHEALQQLSLGCHVFHPEEKATHYTKARAQIALTVADLLVFNKEDKLAERLEDELLPKIGGLIRVAEQQEHRGGRFRNFGSARRRR